MKTQKSSSHANGNGSSHNPAARATAAQNIADVARKHFKMLKAEYKQARKAYRQAKKAAKRAHKEAEAAAEILKAKAAVAKQRRAKKPVKRAQPLHRKTQTATAATAIPLPDATGAATPSISTGTA
jgi:hypothetical protein